jgi:hypothetical protein
MRVVNVRAAELRKAGFPSLVAWLAADARHVYVGRRCAYVKGAEADAPLHNPFSAAARRSPPAAPASAARAP